MMGLDEDDYGNSMASFDIAKEMLRVLPRPAPDLISLPWLTVYENKTAFLVRTTSQDSEYSSIDFWVMEEDIDAPRSQGDVEVD
ncbi:hypothetical protein K1719_033336 [Acacia pycnantha]|nr:hypothetical protein K1719_033336 [Acacia pycnantha]